MKSLILSRHLARFLLLVAIIPFCAAGALAQPDATEAQIRTVMSAQVAAWNRGDIDGFMEGYARSGATEFVSGDTITRGWQTVRDRYQKKYRSREMMGRLIFSEIKITPLGPDAAMVVGRWRLVRQKDRPHGVFTLLFHRAPAGWRIVHDHTS